jgi:hypothetical protein
VNSFRVGFASGLLVFLYALVFFGFTRKIAQRFEGHPFADAWIGLY